MDADTDAEPLDLDTAPWCDAPGVKRLQLVKLRVEEQCGHRLHQETDPAVSETGVGTGSSIRLNRPSPPSPCDVSGGGRLAPPESLL